MAKVDPVPRLAAVVLAGGAAKRMGGAVKPVRTVSGVTLLDRVLAAVASARPRVAVGPPDLRQYLPSDVELTCEQPPGGGPVAAVAAGVAHLTPLDGAPGLVAVLAADLPFLTAQAVAGLADTVSSQEVDGAVLADDTGHPQWLAGVWRLAALADGLARLGAVHARPMAQLVAGLRVVVLAASQVPGRPPAWFDCDTEADLQQAEEWSHGDAG